MIGRPYQVAPKPSFYLVCVCVCVCVCVRVCVCACALCVYVRIGVHQVSQGWSVSLYCLTAYIITQYVIVD